MRREDPGEYMKKAQSILKPGFFGKLFSSNSSRKEEAIEYYKTAGNLYKLNKDWSNAGKAYEECAKAEESLGGSIAAVYYKDSAFCYMYTDIAKHNEMIDKCIRINQLHGKYLDAAKIVKELAANFEKDKNFEMAINTYKRANELLKMDSSDTKNQEQTNLLKIADLSCNNGILGTYAESGNIYETIAYDYLSNPARKFSAVDLLYKAIICHLVNNDEVTADVLFNKFTDDDNIFAENLETKVLNKIITIMKDEPVNVQMVEAEIMNFRNYKKDPWFQNMLNLVIINIRNKDMEDLK